MKRRILFLGLFLCLLLDLSCTVVSVDRTFPKLDWCWSRDAKYQREYDRQVREERRRRQAQQTAAQLEAARQLAIYALTNQACQQAIYNLTNQ